MSQTRDTCDTCQYAKPTPDAPAGSDALLCWGAPPHVVALPSPRPTTAAERLQNSNLPPVVMGVNFSFHRPLVSSKDSACALYKRHADQTQAAA